MWYTHAGMGHQCGPTGVSDFIQAIIIRQSKLMWQGAFQSLYLCQNVPSAWWPRLIFRCYQGRGLRAEGKAGADCILMAFASPLLLAPGGLAPGSSPYLGLDGPNRDSKGTFPLLWPVWGWELRTSQAGRGVLIGGYEQCIRYI